MTEITRDKPANSLIEVLSISAPASMSGLNRVVTQFVDGYMVSYLGAATVTGQAMGGLMAFMPESFVRGVLSVVNTYVSQNLGAGRHKRCGQYTWAGLLLVLCGVVLLCPLAAIAGPIFRLIGHELDVQAMEVIYFRYMILSAPIALAIRVLEGFFYGIHRPRMVFAVSFFTAVLNVFGNWVLVFGHLGAPSLGLHGAAIASVCAWAIQLVVLMALFLSLKFHKQFGTRLIRAMRLKQCREILRIGLPAGMSFFVDIATWTVFMTLLVGHFGKLHLTAASHAMRYMRISFIPTIGIGIAATVLVGRYIGMGRQDLARRRVYAALAIAMLYMGLCGLTFIVFRHSMIKLFVSGRHQAYSAEDSARILAIGSKILVCMSIFQLADAVHIVFSGALRGAGDTRWPMWATAVTSLLILVCGGSAIIHFRPDLESLGPFGAAATCSAVMAALLAGRFRSGMWRKINLLGPNRAGSALPASPAPVTPPSVITVEPPCQDDNPPDAE